MATRVPARLSSAEGRQFAFVVGAAFLLFAGLAFWRGHPTSFRVMVAVGGLLLLAGLLVPGRLGPVYRLWMGGATAMSKVTTPVFMGVVYFLVLTPIGVLKQLVGGRSTRRAGAQSYWVQRPEGARRSDLERQF